MSDDTRPRTRPLQDPLPEPMIWHSGFPPHADPPENVDVILWVMARDVWMRHHDDGHGWCRTCSNVPAPCPDQVLAQHGLIRAIIDGNGFESMEALRLLAREARDWLPDVPAGPIAGVNIAGGISHVLPPND